MIREYDYVVLTRDIPEEGLLAGDVGCVIGTHKGGEAFEIEFATADGTTVALLALTAEDIRPRGKRELLQVREYTRRTSA